MTVPTYTADEVSVRVSESKRKHRALPQPVGIWKLRVTLAKWLAGPWWTIEPRRRKPRTKTPIASQDGGIQTQIEFPPLGPVF